MLAQIVLGLIAERLFEAVSAGHRSFTAEINRYLDRRGFVESTQASTTPAR